MSSEPRILLTDLGAENAPLEAELLEACGRVLRSQRFILGPEVAALERELESYLGCGAAVAVSSGTDALVVALHALGVGGGDEVVTTPLSFFATVGAILRVGARPVFADVDPETLTLDPARAGRAFTPRTRAVVPVHLFGQPAEMDALGEVARRHDVAVVEDAAQAFGARYAGKQAGTFGHAGCFSFFPTKNLGGFGDAGAVVTDLPAVAERARRARGHGFRERHVAVGPGGNYRMDELQAALLRVKLRKVDAWVQARRRHAASYRELFARLSEPARALFRLPSEPGGSDHAYNQFVIAVPGRDALADYLRSRGVETAVYYPVPLHLQPSLENLGYREGDFPVAEAACRERLALPIGPELAPHALERIVRDLAAFAAGLAQAGD